MRKFKVSSSSHMLHLRKIRCKLNHVKVQEKADGAGMIKKNINIVVFVTCSYSMCRIRQND